MDIKSFDIKKFEKYFSAKSSEDLNRFLEKLPAHAGKNILIAAGVVWAMAAALGLYTSIQAQELTKLRAELKEVQALKPEVPVIKNIDISKEDIEKFVNLAKESYRGLDFKVTGSVIVITSTKTASFAEFREAIGHVQNGGDGWRVSLEKLCVGRECDKSFKLAASLKINKVNVQKPS